MSSKIEQLRAWLTTTNQFFESINLKKDQRRLSYADYLQFRKELETQEPFYTKLKSQHEDKSLGDYTHSWKDIDTNWQKVETQVNYKMTFIFWARLPFFTLFQSLFFVQKLNFGIFLIFQFFEVFLLFLFLVESKFLTKLNFWGKN